MEEMKESLVRLRREMDEKIIPHMRPLPSVCKTIIVLYVVFRKLLVMYMYTDSCLCRLARPMVTCSIGSNVAILIFVEYPFGF